MGGWRAGRRGLLGLLARPAAPARSPAHTTQHHTPPRSPCPSSPSCPPHHPQTSSWVRRTRCASSARPWTGAWRLPAAALRWSLRWRRERPAHPAAPPLNAPHPAPHLPLTAPHPPYPPLQLPGSVCAQAPAPLSACGCASPEGTALLSRRGRPHRAGPCRAAQAQAAAEPLPGWTPPRTLSTLGGSRYQPPAHPDLISLRNVARVSERSTAPATPPTAALVLFARTTPLIPSLHLHHSCGGSLR